MLRGWFVLVGANDFTLRYFSLMCGVALVALIFTLARRLLGARHIAQIAMLLIALSPVEIWYSTEGKMYTLQPLLLVLALYVVLRYLGLPKVSLSRSLRRTQGTIWLIVFVVCVGASYFVQLLSPLFLPIAFAAVLLFGSTHARSRIVFALLAMALCVAAYLPFAQWQLPLVRDTAQTGHTFYSLWVMLSTLALNWTVGLHGLVPFGLDAQFVWLLVLVALVPLLMLFRARQNLRVTALLLIWMLAPILMLYLISLRAPLFEPRYLLWCAPALYMLFANAVSSSEFGVWSSVPSSTFEIRGGAPRPLRTLNYELATLLLLMSVLIWGNLAHGITPLRPSLREAAAWVRPQLQPDDADLFQIGYTHFAFEHYGAAPTSLEAPFTNNAMTSEMFDATLRPLVAPFTRIWLIESESAMWDARGMTRAWCEQNLQRLDARDWHGVSVRLYAVPRALQSPHP